MTVILTSSILGRLEDDQVKLFDQWKKAGFDEVHALISAILRERPPVKDTDIPPGPGKAPATAKESRSSGRSVLLQERGLHLSKDEIDRIIKKEIARQPGASKDALKESFVSLFIQQGNTPEEAARLAGIAIAGRGGGA
jgi:hypothetical protein